MTRQMADDEVLRVLDLAYYAVPDNRGDLAEQLHQVGRYVAALQAERDSARKYATTLAQAMLRKHYAEDAPQWEPCPDLLGVLTQIDNMTTGLTRTDRAERAESALEALRGQVEELMKFREGGLPTKGWLRDNDQSRRVLHELNELLAIKERMG